MTNLYFTESLFNMHFHHFQLSIISLLSFLLFSYTSSAQSDTPLKSKIQYGIGVGIIYGDYYESENLPEGFDIDIDRARVSPAVNAYVAYSASDQLKLTFSPGFNFHLHYEPFSQRNLSAIHLHLPVGVQRKMVGNLSVIGDIYYDYLINQSYEYEGENGSFTDLADTRNLFGASLGLAYSVGKYAEIQLTGSHLFNTVNSFSLTGLDGDVLGDVKLKNRFLKLNFILRG